MANGDRDKKERLRRHTVVHRDSRTGPYVSKKAAASKSAGTGSKKKAAKKR